MKTFTRVLHCHIQSSLLWGCHQKKGHGAIQVCRVHPPESKNETKCESQSLRCRWTDAHSHVTFVWESSSNMAARCLLLTCNSFLLALNCSITQFTLDFIYHSSVSSQTAVCQDPLTTDLPKCLPAVSLQPHSDSDWWLNVQEFESRQAILTIWGSQRISRTIMQQHKILPAGDSD